MLNFYDCKAKANVVKVEKKSGYSVLKLRTARKDKKTDKWINSTFSFVRFVMTAHDEIDSLIAEVNTCEKFDSGDAKKGIPIILKSVSFGNEPYEKNGETVYPKNYQISVFSWDFGEGYEKVSNNEQPDESSHENDEFPF
jgi:hypothetical protein